MNLIEVVKKYQNKILDDGILVEYDLFFKEDAENGCHFAIDEYEELRELDNVILKIRESDKDAEIYVHTYGVDFSKERIYIYADTIWINTVMNVEEIYSFFRNLREIEPADIVVLAEDETIDGPVALVVSTEYKVEDYETFIEKRKLSEIQSLYWD